MENVQCTSPGDGQTSCKVWLASGDGRRWSNEGKTRNRLKFAGVPQTSKPISAVNGLKFALLWRHVEKILMFNNFFRLSIHALVAKIHPDKVVRWCPDGEFCRFFCVVYFSEPRAARFRPAS